MPSHEQRLGGTSTRFAVNRCDLVAVIAIVALIAGLLLYASASTSASTDLAGTPRPPAPIGSTHATSGSKVEPPTTSSPYRFAHASVAEALGYVAIECWVGTTFDTDELVSKHPTGPIPFSNDFHQRISNGWYTNVEKSLSGWHGVHRRAPWSPMGEALFVVSWSATAPGEVVPCKVHPLDSGTLRVTVHDPEGRPVPQVEVHGCLSHGKTDAEGLAVLENAHAVAGCSVTAQMTGPSDGAPQHVCYGAQTIEGLAAGETEEVDLQLRCGTWREVHDVDGDEEPELRVLDTQAETDRLYDLSDEDVGEPGNQVVEDLLVERELLHALFLAVRRRDELFGDVESMRLWIDHVVYGADTDEEFIANYNEISALTHELMAGPRRGPQTPRR